MINLPRFPLSLNIRALCISALPLAMICSATSASFAATPPASKELYVQVKDTALRSEPKFWSTSVSNLSYGTILTPVAASSDSPSWVKVKYNEQEGYVHLSSVTKRKVILNTTSNAPTHGVDSSTVVLAGKGFSKQVEGSYANSKGVSYASVDAVEGYKIKSDEFSKFLHEGGLNEK